MYRYKPLFELPTKIELSNVMYALPQVDSGLNNEVNTNDELATAPSNKETTDLEALEKRWDKLLITLNNINDQLNSLKNSIESSNNDDVKASPTTLAISSEDIKSLDGVVIFAGPASPPYSIVLLKHIFRNDVNLKLSCHRHSSVIDAPNDDLKYFYVPVESSKTPIHITLVWKEGVLTPQMVVNPITSRAIHGEANILRYIARLGFSALKYGQDELADLQADSILDAVHKLFFTRTVKERGALFRYLNAKLGRLNFFGGNEPSICDLVVWSILKQLQSNRVVDLNQDITQNMQKWYFRVDSFLPSYNK